MADLVNYFTDDAGDDVGEGTTKKKLQMTTSETNRSLSLADKRNWNYKTSISQFVPSGNWTCSVDINAGSGPGSLLVTLTVKIYSAAKVLQATIINEEKTITKGTAAEYAWGAASGSINIESGGFVVVEVWRSGGTITCDVRYDNHNNAGYDSRLQHPEPSDQIDLNAIGMIMRTHHVWRRPEPEAWINCVPYQKIDGATGTFKIGVVTGKAAAISKVVFKIICGGSETYNSQSTYTFPDCTTETWNERTVADEFCITIENANFSGDNEFTVEAEVHGTNGEVADKTTGAASGNAHIGLDPIPLVCNKGGSYDGATAWVDTGGDDGTGEVNNESKPYATIHGAWKDLRDWMNGQGKGSRIDFCTVRLAPNQAHQFHRADSTEIVTSYGWTTVTCESGQSYLTTRIDASGTTRIPKTKLVCIDNVQIGPGDGSYRMDYSSYDSWLWCKNGKTCGTNRHSATTGAYPIGTNTGTEVPTRLFVTDHKIDEVRFAFPYADYGPPDYGPHFARNVIITSIGEDACRNVHSVLNCSIDDVDPGATGWHADAFQLDSEFPWENVLWKNNECTDLDYQGVMFNSDYPASRFAVVNCRFQIDNDDTATFMHLRSSIFGLKVLQCTFDYRDTTPPNTKTGRVFWGVPSSGYDEDVQVGDVEVEGNIVASLWYLGDNYPAHPMGGPPADCGYIFILEDSSYADHNNFYFPEDSGAEPDSQTPGTDVTTQDPELDSGGRPLGGSPVRSRLTTIVAHDLSGRARGSVSDLGAYEGSPLSVFDREPQLLQPLCGV